MYLSTRLVRANHNIPMRSFSIAVPARKQADSVPPKPRGFLAEKDSFARREAAHEGMYIRATEAEKLQKLRVKMKEQRRHLDELEEHIKEVTGSQGGEQN